MFQIDAAEPLTEEQEEMKQYFLEEGFKNWNKKDFQQFVKATEKYGRKDVDSISLEVEGKTPDEVKEYAKVFWSRYGELAEKDKVIAQIER